MLFRHIFSTVCSLILLLSVFVRPVWAQQLEKHSAPPLVILTLDGLTYQDINENVMPNLTHYLQTSACGLTNINTAGSRSEVNSYLSTGSGTKVNGTALAAWSGKQSESVRIPNDLYAVSFADLYKRWNGKEISNAIVVPDIAGIQTANKSVHWGSHLGILGDTLHAHGYRTVVIGNADDGQQLNRLAPLFLMDSKGIVDAGDVSGDLLQKDLTRPFGVRLNSDKMWDIFEKEARQKTVVLIQWGDLNRLDHVMKSMDPQHVIEIRTQILREADKFIGKIMSLQDKPGIVMITAIAPLHSPVTEKQPNLLPVIVKDHLRNKDKVITSPTTHRQGLISNFDIAPSILHWIDPNIQENSGNLGHQILFADKPKGAGNITSWLENDSDNLSFIYTVRPQILSVYVHMSGFTLLLVGFVYMWKKRWIYVFRGVLEWIATGPLAMLLISIFHPHAELAYLISLLGIQLFIIGCIRFWAKESDRILAVLALTVSFIIFDIVERAVWMKQSALGYDLIVGARYYGIGNEYMGVLLGSALTGLVLVHYRQQRKRGFEVKPLREDKVINFVTLFVGSLIVYLMAAPQFGTNAGGAIAAMVGFSMLWLVWRGKSIWKSFLLSALLITSVGMIAMVVINIMLPQEYMTHIGQAANLLFHGDFEQIGAIAIRKMQMNFHLMQVSMWGTLLYITAGIVCLWLLRSKIAKENSLHRGYQAILGCTFAAFICNDSGVLAAAAILLFAAIVIFAITIDSTTNESMAGYEKLEQTVG